MNAQADSAPLDSGAVVQAVMMKGLLDQINMLLEPSGWRLMRTPFLDEINDSVPTFLATPIPGGPVETALRSEA